LDGSKTIKTPHLTAVPLRFMAAGTPGRQLQDKTGKLQL